MYAWYHDPSSSGSPDILFARLLYYTKCQSQKREIIQSNIYRILPKGNQVIYTLDTISEPNSMILAQAVLKIFCPKRSQERGITLQKQVQRKRKKYVFAYFSCLFHILNFKILSLTVLDRMQCVTDIPTDRPKTIRYLNFCEVGSIKITLTGDNANQWCISPVVWLLTYWPTARGLAGILVSHVLSHILTPQAFSLFAQLLWIINCYCNQTMIFLYRILSLKSWPIYEGWSECFETIFI